MTAPDAPLSSLVIQLFGPFEVFVNGSPLPHLRSRKGQWLLALLTLRAGSPVERSWLAGTLWPDSSESQALASLRMSLKDLRRALGPEAHRLRSPTPHTLSLELVNAQVDLLAFDLGVGAGDPPALERAISLYRGPLLEGWTEEWVFQERQARQQAYLQALESLAAQALTGGDPAAAERHVRLAVAADPLRESAQRTLMQALATGGNYAAAMQVYREVRLLLHRELNAEPDPETTALFQQIRAEAREKAVPGGEPPRSGGLCRVPSGKEDDLFFPARHRPPLRGGSPPGTRHGSEATLTFLFTDVEGSTRLWEQHPDAMRLALARHHVLVTAAIEQHDGRVIISQGEGDSFFAVFGRASDSVAAAAAVQLSLRAEPWPAEAPLRVRVALHTGEAELRGGDYYGVAVNRCARLRAVAHGGQTLVSQTTAALVRDDLPEGVSLRELGTHRLKDLQRAEPIFQLLHPELPSEFPPLRSLGAFAHNLPLQLTRFIGRERQMAEVKRLLQSARLLTITGAGGCGKTRLALQVAADILPEYPDGVWLVELAALADPALVPQTVAAALGVREEPGQPLPTTVADYLRPRTLLLVLDNCEHLLSACAQLAEGLLRGCPTLRLLTTSREGLGLAGEQTYPVPSLSVPDPRQLPSLEHLQEFEAVSLFADRALLSQPDFAVTGANALAVAQLCHQLDGIPLAIELAAARVKALPVEKIAERLEDRFRLLIRSSHTVLPRQQTLRACIDWSFHLLSEPERTLFRRLSVFAGGWTLEAAETVCAGKGIEEWEIVDLLTSLVEKSLVVYEQPGRESRYRLLETVRQYARDRLLEAGEGNEVRGRHRDCFLRLTEQAEPELHRADQNLWFERLEMEHDNLRAALAWCQAESGAAEVGLRLACMLNVFWAVRGHHREGSEWLASLLEAAGPARRTPSGARALRVAGLMANGRGEYEHATVLLEESLATARELGERRLQGDALWGLGLVATAQGRLRQAAAWYEESLALLRIAGDTWDIALTLGNLARVMEFLGDAERAIALFEEGLVLMREVGYPRTIAFPCFLLGLALYRQGQYERAEALGREGLAHLEPLGRRGTAQGLFLLGLVAERRGEYDRAAAQFEESRVRFGEEREKGHLLAQKGMADCLHHLGEVARARGDLSQAVARHREALSLLRELGGKGGIEAARSAVDCLEGLARVLTAHGWPRKAARLFGAAEALREAMGAPGMPADPANDERQVATVRGTLGEEAFAAAWVEGRAMALQEAIAYALECGFTHRTREQ